ncbi:MAG TPA: hypothetical protein VFG19_11290 [Geobacteraceae bacterium]|nr:hypothetical protein [Geobacteraceae bacterium]
MKFRYFGVFEVIVYSMLALATTCWSATKPLTENSVETSQSVKDGKVSAARITVESSNGGPEIIKMRTDYPARAVLQVEASLTVKEGYYKVELLNSGKPSLVLEAKDGKTVRVKGRMSVTSGGDVEYRVTSRNARNSCLELSFTPVSKALSQSTKRMPANRNADRLSEAEYKASCKQIAAGELTKNADMKKGQLVKVTGQIIVFEESGGSDAVTRLIISVKDDTNKLPSGKLPIYVSFHGKTDSFINDTVTIYGTIYGNDIYQSPQIQKKTLPRVDAKYIMK